MGLFSGIGGFELAFSRRGVECVGLCDIDPVAQEVLRFRFPNVPISGDIQKLKGLQGAEILTAGFPCQDLSQAGEKVGIRGARSGLVDEIFRLIAAEKRKPKWVILENVSYMLKLKQGRAMEHVIKQAEALGYNWAYRVLDARSFGLPQRRERVVILLSLEEDPSQVLFPTGYVIPNVDDAVGFVDEKSSYGFYWTEGKRGLGWVKDAVPTIKGGSALGIPSPPAIWVPSTGQFGTPSILDAERMFGFPAGWTEPAIKQSSRAGARWKLVGNTICVPMVDWVAEQIEAPKGLGAPVHRIAKTARLPKAAYGLSGQRYSVDVSTWAIQAPAPRLAAFLQDPLKPLSLRAASGFYQRAQESTAIRFADGFLPSMAAYIEDARLVAAS
ncbi:DNA (cytosine-5-)-methyltransferase [Pseudoxanthomonas gei]|uniref:Cytosine-specific methyltransferase n=1 Tax=Pseudoxanthomonas gei TaxID=1383030 RepID=A0ABX0AHT3_9GAMM|nr:DNA (cytosine-5-)-methyltransferase [Pseudoxanthomonas gei]NDK38814.1 DNA (cytosine-5-)-methyltransferase [Pseudoxanthomonas gei]